MTPFLGITEADGFALAMLVMLIFALGSVLIILIRVFRNSGKHEESVDEFGDDYQDEPVSPSGRKDSAPSEPWEKEADWWKK